VKYLNLLIPALNAAAGGADIRLLVCANTLAGFDAARLALPLRFLPGRRPRSMSSSRAPTSV